MFRLDMYGARAVLGDGHVVCSTHSIPCKAAFAPHLPCIRQKEEHETRVWICDLHIFQYTASRRLMRQCPPGCDDAWVGPMLGTGPANGLLYCGLHRRPGVGWWPSAQDAIKVASTREHVMISAIDGRLDKYGTNMREVRKVLASSILGYLCASYATNSLSIHRVPCCTLQCCKSRNGTDAIRWRV